MENLRIIYENVKNSLSFTLFKLGETEITFWLLLSLIVYLLLLYYATSFIKKWLISTVLASKGIQIGVRQSIGTLIRYVLVVVGLVFILTNVGIDLTSFTVVAGALGVGIGFGLQNIVSNWISGIIILFERPIKVGDRIRVGKVDGNVHKIAIRATTVLTNENIAVIIPNSEFINCNVTNLSHSESRVRFNIHVGVAYGSDLELVKRLLIEAADEHEGVLKDPKPDVAFDEFGDSALLLRLRVWTTEYHTRPGRLRSELNFAIERKFRENKIEIPFPTRDINVRTMPHHDLKKITGEDPPKDAGNVKTN